MKQKIKFTVVGLALFLLLGSAKPISLFVDPNTIIINQIKIEILGNSTVGKYKCNCPHTYRDTIYLNSTTKNSLKSEIATANFDCGNRIMNKDLKTTIKVTKFPKSTVTITNIKPSGSNYTCSLNFRITDKTLSYQNLNLTNTKEALEGTVSVKFTDLGLEPPTKMGGVIKVKNEFIIHFVLYKL
ncbi:YceI family protein [Flavobacterium sp. 5]|uniref:YceI family protein n=1 Tax=Flavobacterium sp. 5 TaxID=2035199 RepID=UPI000C2CCEDE|nr:YceI family protein [Flavobacterium sp. 5]PKB16057.1 YceI-like domain-containing protein [Flavobacterium sp. 5]